MPRPKKQDELVTHDNGYYYLHGDVAGRYKQISTGEKEYSKACAWLVEFRNGEKKAIANQGSRTVHQCLDYYQSNYVEMGGVTNKETTISYLDLFRAYYGTETFVDELKDVAKQNGFIKWRRSYRSMKVLGAATRAKAKGYKPKPVADGTIFNNLSMFAAALNYCADKNFIPHAPKIHKDTIERSQPRQRYFTEQETEELRSVLMLTGGRPGCLPPLLVLFEIGLYTGRRRHAIETLTWFQVDFKKGKIRFQKPGQKETSKRKGEIDIAPGLMPVLEQAYQERTNEWVLESPHRRTKSFKAACIRAGFIDASAHTLRHTFVSWGLQKGLTLWQISKLLACSVKTLERTYGHENEDANTAALQAIFSRKPQPITLLKAEK
jgi:integrase